MPRQIFPRKMSKKLLALSLIILSCGCLEKSPENTWLSIKPVGCLENMWEQLWVVGHGMDFEGYPGENESIILGEYLKSKGVEVLALEYEDLGGALCDGCSCPRGDRIFILVPYENVSAAKAARFEEPAPEYYCNTVEDCIIVSDCCGCARGGRNYAINKKHGKEWDEHLVCGQASCRETATPHETCDGTLSCLHNECRLTA